MANDHSMAKTKTPTKNLRDTSQRHYTVGYISVRHQLKATPAKTHYSKHPALHLKDNWLEAMGFKTGQAITITVKRAN